MIMTTRSAFVVEMLLFFQSQMQTCAGLSWDCPVQAAQEERDEDKLEQVSMSEAGCFGFFKHEGP